MTRAPVPLLLFLLISLPVLAHGAGSPVDALALPALSPYVHSVEAGSQNAVDPHRPSVLSAGIDNEGEEATDVVLTLTLPDGGSFLGVEGEIDRASCTTSEAAAVCRWPTIGLSDPANVRLRYLPPDRDDGAPFRVHAEVTASQADANPGTRVQDFSIPLRRRFVVDSFNEDGRGSLRQALWDVSVNCIATPCLLEFRTAAPLRPVLPLPALKGYVKIAGRDVRPEIDGTFVGQGGAFAGDICELRIENVALRNFPGHAIDARRDPECRGDLIGGFYLSDSELTGNLRGVVLTSLGGRITNNIIRDSRRAGIFINDAGDLRITHNTISHNGASGIFVGLTSSPPYTYYLRFVQITNNVIRDNFEWGVCRTHDGIVQIEDNEIAGNRYYAFDVDLDFDTPHVPAGNPSLPDKPLLLSATYDALTNKTLLRVSADVSPVDGPTRLDVYASDAVSSEGHPQAERQIASVNVWQGDGTIALDGDLRGQFITAAITREIVIDLGFSIANTSEISNPVKVD